MADGELNVDSLISRLLEGECPRRADEGAGVHKRPGDGDRMCNERRMTEG